MSERAQFVLICLCLLLLANLLTAIHIHPKEGFSATLGQATVPFGVTLPPTSYAQGVSVGNSAIQAANQASVLASRAEQMEMLLAGFAAQKSIQAGTSAALARGLSTQNFPVSAGAGITSVGITSNLNAAILAQSNALAALGLVGMGAGTSTQNYIVAQNPTGAVPAGVTFTAATSRYTLPTTLA